MSTATKAKAMTVVRDIQRKFNNAIEGAISEMQTIGLEWTAYNTRVVSSWTGKPQFTYRVIASRPNVFDLEIEARGDHKLKWLWTDKGTEPHTIPRAPLPYNLKFRSEYSPRTRPVARYGVGTGRSTGAWVSTPVVHHPGTTPREFTETYKRDNEDQIREQILTRIRRELAR